MRGQQCQLLALTPETWGQGWRNTTCQSLQCCLSLLPSEHITKPDFTTEPIFFFFFFSLQSFVSCPLSRGKVPARPHPTLHPGCLCFSHNLCFVYWHINIYNSKPVWFPAQTERSILERVQGLYHVDQGLYSPCRVKHTRLRVIWSGRNWNRAARKRSQNQIVL